MEQGAERDDFAGLGSAHALDVAEGIFRRTRYDRIRNRFDCAFEITDGRRERVLVVNSADVVPKGEDEKSDARLLPSWQDWQGPDGRHVARIPEQATGCIPGRAGARVRSDPG